MPFADLVAELLSAGRGQLVPLSPPARGVVPFRLHQLRRFEAMEDGIERAGLQREALAAGFLEPRLDQVTVLGSVGEGRQDHHVEAAAPEFCIKSIHWPTAPIDGTAIYCHTIYRVSMHRTPVAPKQPGCLQLPPF